MARIDDGQKWKPQTIREIKAAIENIRDRIEEIDRIAEGFFDDPSPTELRKLKEERIGARTKVGHLRIQLAGLEDAREAGERLGQR